MKDRSAGLYLPFHSIDSLGVFYQIFVLFCLRGSTDMSGRGDVDGAEDGSRVPIASTSVDV